MVLNALTAFSMFVTTGIGARTVYIIVAIWHGKTPLWWFGFE